VQGPEQEEEKVEKAKKKKNPPAVRQGRRATGGTFCALGVEFVRLLEGSGLEHFLTAKTRRARRVQAMNKTREEIEQIAE